MVGLAIGGLVVVLLVTLFVLPAVVPAPKLKPMADPQADVRPEDNGWPLLQQACAALQKSERELPGFPTPFTAYRRDLAAHVRNNEPALALLRQTLTKPALALPRRSASGSPHEGAQALSACRDLARLVAQRAYLRKAAGDLPGALNDALQAVELGQRLEASGGSLLDLLVGIAVEAIGQRAVQRLLGPPPEGTSPTVLDPTERWPMARLAPPERQAMAHTIAWLSSHEHHAEALQRTFSGDFIDDLAVLKNPKAGAALINTMDPTPLRHNPPRFIYDAPRTVALMQQVDLAFVRLATEPRWERDFTTVPGLREPSRWLPRYNHRGKLVVSLSGGLGRPAFDFADRMVAWNRSTCILLALRLYVDQHGRLPKALNELDLPPELLVDPFDCHTLRYRPREALVYSVGRNGRDDGGAHEGEADDEAAPLEFVRESDRTREAREGR
jgi:hypothetical protein